MVGVGSSILPAPTNLINSLDGNQQNLRTLLARKWHAEWYSAKNRLLYAYPLLDARTGINQYRTVIPLAVVPVA
jgi:hypothetical protein